MMSGPTWMHVHQSDDEAWHVLEERLRFKLPDREVDVTPGTTVFVPAVLAHTYWAVDRRRPATPRCRGALVRVLVGDAVRSVTP